VTHGVPRDPVLVAGVVRVTDAARVVVRLIQPQDAGLQRAFFRGLSQESRYGRFMAMVKDAPEALIERLAPVDHIHHLALLAVVIEHGREVMIGEARYVVDDEDASTCKLALWAPCSEARQIGRGKPRNRDRR
jgi:acetyltransferase